MVRVPAPAFPTVRTPAVVARRRSASSSFTRSVPVAPDASPTTAAAFEVIVPVVSVVVATSPARSPTVTPPLTVCGLDTLSVTLPCRNVCEVLVVVLELNVTVYVPAMLYVRASAAVGTWLGVQFVAMDAEPPAGLFHERAAMLAPRAPAARSVIASVMRAERSFIWWSLRVAGCASSRSSGLRGDRAFYSVCREMLLEPDITRNHESRTGPRGTRVSDAATIGYPWDGGGQRACPRLTAPRSRWYNAATSSSASPGARSTCSTSSHAPSENTARTQTTASMSIAS